MRTLFTEAQMDSIARQVFLPLVLLINYTLFQYLLAFYWRRRYEHRMRLLFAIGFLGAACLIPFAQPDIDIVHGLNDISEACSVVTFLIQITIIGYDLNAKFKIRSVIVLTYVAEFLIFANTVMIAVSIVETFAPGTISDKVIDSLPNTFESITVFFIFFFRFYYIGISRGWRVIVRTRKVEVLCYLLFATHELPFEVLTSATGVSWEFVQAVYMRLTIAGCLIRTARGKVKSSSTYNTSKVSAGGGGGGYRRGSATFRLSTASKRHSAVSSIPRVAVARLQELN
uniref:Uncharacterized protein n=1 Tax=Globisporangium ultimum (strain ATCC 200006 / CBS 805.95 / DAOM BR144) TaxID=431595 RepID=K3WY37_GLOUD